MPCGSPDTRRGVVLWVVLLGVLAASGCDRTGVRTSDIEQRLRAGGIPARSVERNSDGTFVVDWSESTLTDLSPLRGVPVSSLDLHKTSVRDLSPLRGLPLTRLILCKSQVSDLSPLKGLALTTLKCSETGVRDLSPLRGMPLRTLWIQGTPVTDLSPLRGMPLKELRFSPERIVAGMDVVQETPTLVWINQVPAATFRSRSGTAGRP